MTEPGTQGTQDKLDAAPLVTRLLEKSLNSKVDWKPTADRQAFVTSVGGGELSFKISLVSTTDIDDFGQPESVEVPRLDMLDEKGKVLWYIHTGDVPGGKLHHLYDAARRIGNRLDERLASAMSALDKL